MLRRVLAAIKEAFTPHWDMKVDEDPAETSFLLATSAMQTPSAAPILGTAAIDFSYSKHPLVCEHKGGFALVSDGIFCLDCGEKFDRFPQ